MMTFKQVVDAFTVIAQTRSRNDIIVRLADLFYVSTPSEARMLTYLCLGQVRAPYLGNQFNIAEKTINKIITHVQNHDIPQHHATLKEIFDQLVELQTIGGQGSQAQRTLFIERMLRTLTPQEGEFVLRIILCKLRTGFSDMTLIDAFSWMLVGNKSLHKQIESAYSICADLGLIASLLKKDRTAGLAAVHLTLGIPVLPALAERLPTARAIIEKLGHCVAQPKLDGFRLQVHISTTHTGKQVWFYSRNLMNMTPLFPELTKVAHALPINSAIFEGEAIVFDESTGAFLPFQQTVKRKRKHGISSAAQDFPLKLFVFDLLYLNGHSLIDSGHEERRARASTFLSHDHTNTISLINEYPVSDAAQLEYYFLAALEEGLEGLVVKRMHAHYQPGKRNFNWIKLKRTAASGTLSDTIDAVILGYYNGRGRRATLGIGALLVGVYDQHKDTYQTIAKVGTGLTDQEFRDIKKRCDERAVADKPSDVFCAKELYPDVWVQPELIIVVAADEITRSPVHTAGKSDHNLGYALRFPRMVEMRNDKSAQQATTVDEIKNMVVAF